MNCYITRDGTKAAIGGQFNANDGSYRMIPDRWLHEAKINDDGTALILRYSTWTIEISGCQLKKIYDDTAEGRLGKVIIAVPSDDIEAEEAAKAAGVPFVKTITHISIRQKAANDTEQND
jgi:hypothetical protein